MRCWAVEPFEGTHRSACALPLQFTVSKAHAKTQRRQGIVGVAEARIAWWVGRKVFVDGRVRGRHPHPPAPSPACGRWGDSDWVGTARPAGDGEMRLGGGALKSGAARDER